MPVKFGKTSKQVDRNTKKVTIVHEYMKVYQQNRLNGPYEQYRQAFEMRKCFEELNQGNEQRKEYVPVTIPVPTYKV